MYLRRGWRGGGGGSEREREREESLKEIPSKNNRDILITAQFSKLKICLHLQRGLTLSPESHTPFSMSWAAAARSARQVGEIDAGSERRTGYIVWAWRRAASIALAEGVVSEGLVMIC